MRVGRLRSYVRPVDAAWRPLALMQSADRLPISLSRSDAHDSKRALPIPGTTGSHHFIIAPAISSFWGG